MLELEDLLDSDVEMISAGGPKAIPRGILDDAIML